MSLPVSRNTNYAAGSQVKSADLNKIQDCIVQGAHGAQWRDALIYTGRATGGVVVTLNDSLGVTHSGGTGGAFRVPIWLVPGERITGARARVTPASGAVVTVGIQKVTDGGAPSTVGSQSPGSSGTATQTIQRTDLAEDVADSAGILYMLTWFVPTTTGSVLLAAQYATTWT